MLSYIDMMFMLKNIIVDTSYYIHISDPRAVTTRLLLTTMVICIVIRIWENIYSRCSGKHNKIKDRLILNYMGGFYYVSLISCIFFAVLLIFLSFWYSFYSV